MAISKFLKSGLVPKSANPKKSRLVYAKHYFLRLEFGVVVVWRRCRLVNAKRRLFCKSALSSIRNANFRRARRATDPTSSAEMTRPAI